MSCKNEDCTDSIQNLFDLIFMKGNMKPIQIYEVFLKDINIDDISSFVLLPLTHKYSIDFVKEWLNRPLIDDIDKIYIFGVFLYFFCTFGNKKMALKREYDAKNPGNFFYRNTLGKLKGDSKIILITSLFVNEKYRFEDKYIHNSYKKFYEYNLQKIKNEYESKLMESFIKGCLDGSIKIQYIMTLFKNNFMQSNLKYLVNKFIYNYQRCILRKNKKFLYFDLFFTNFLKLQENIINLSNIYIFEILKNKNLKILNKKYFNLDRKFSDTIDDENWKELILLTNQESKFYKVIYKFIKENKSFKLDDFDLFAILECNNTCVTNLLELLV